MKIIELRSENFKKVKAISIRPKDNVVVVSGANAQGKTSVLDSIWAALSGRKIPQEPIRKGQDKAEVELNLGEYVIKRTITEKGNYLTVTNAAGSSFKSPQSMLDKMLGELSFDPLEFTRMNSQEQIKLLLNILGLSDTLKSLNTNRATFFSERAMVGREVKALLNQLEGMEKIDPAPEETSVIELTKKLQDANRALSSNNVLRGELEKAKMNVVNRHNEFEEAKKRLEDAEKRFEAAEYTKTQKIKEVEALKDPDIGAIEEQFSETEENNRLARAAKTYSIKEDEYKEKQKEYGSLDEQIKAIDNEKEKLLSGAKFPIEGLGFNDFGVTYNNVPFEQASDSEKIKVSLAMAMVLNPTIKVIRISDGSLLDRKNMAAIRQVAKDEDYQIWIEKVDETGKIGFYIEDGEIK